MEDPEDPERLDAPEPPPADVSAGLDVGREAMSQRLATQIEPDVEAPLPWRSIVKKTVMVVVDGWHDWSVGNRADRSIRLRALATVPRARAAVEPLRMRHRGYQS